MIEEEKISFELWRIRTGNLKATFEDARRFVPHLIANMELQLMWMDKNPLRLNIENLVLNFKAKLK